MAVQGESGGKDDVKTQFVTREGTYRLMTLAEYSRPNRVGYTSGGGASHVRVSLVTLPPAPTPPPTADDAPPADDRICFNHGKELYVYVYRGIKKASDLTKPIDKKMYKGTNPTCHDFNTVTMTPDSVALLIGFSTGQIQLIDPIKKEVSKLFNEERVIDKTRVTCIKWVPGSGSQFCAAHASGALCVYSEGLGCGAAPPAFQAHKQGAGYAVYTCRAKTPRNPLYRWVVGRDGTAINEFAFSPCGSRLAVVSQDGLLRVFHWDSMELLGSARSYFGGFLCVCWSPDGRLVVVGGEDDLVTVWCAVERRVLARGQGHRSWVSVVAFDPFAADVDARDPRYRLGSVSQDTQLCLWDLSADVLRPAPRPRASAHLSPAADAEHAPNGIPGGRPPPKGKLAHKHAELAAAERPGATLTISVGKARDEPLAVNSLTQRLAGFSFGDRRSEHRRHLSLSRPEQKGGAGSVSLRGKSAGVGGGGAGAGEWADPLRLIGTPACPRFDECPVLEPLVCKKIAHERLTALVFRAEHFLTACADGCVNTWARPPRPPPAPAPDTSPAAPAVAPRD